MGLKKTGAGLSDLIGGKWLRRTDPLRDFGIAMAFWVVLRAALAVLRYALGSDSTAIKATAGFVPHGRVELMTWPLVSATAGICEEIVFRGYLQRQFLSLTGSPVLAVVLQAFLFGIGHTYQGVKSVIVISVAGGLFGALALWRKSLRPGIIQHASQDFLTGVLRSLLPK